MIKKEKNVISIRLVDLILIVSIIIAGGIFGVKFKNNISISKENNIEIEEKQTEQFTRKTAEVVASSRTETTSREEKNTNTTQNAEVNVQTPEQELPSETESIEQETKQEINTEVENIEPKEEQELNTEFENKEQEEQEENNYISISDVKISQNMDLTIRTGLSREDFITLISGVKADTSGFFEENAGTIYDLCEEYSINEIFFCGLISAESGWNIASNHRNTHNYISLMKNGKLINYSTVEEGLEVAAQKLRTNYLTPGGKFYYGKTLSAVKTKFCPASNTWVSLVYGRMKQII